MWKLIIALILLSANTSFAWSLWGTPVRPQKTKGTANYVVAASDAPASVKAIADYTCDGTEDGVQMQAALDALPAHGGRVYCTGGSYELKNRVTLPSNSILEFAIGNDIQVASDHLLDDVSNQYTKHGRAFSALFVNDGATTDNGNTNVHIIGANVDFDAGTDPQSKFDTDQGYGAIWLDHCTESSIVNCKAMNIVLDNDLTYSDTFGIIVSDSNDCTISKCYADYSAYEGIGVRGGCNRILVEDCLGGGNSVRHFLQLARWVPTTGTSGTPWDCIIRNCNDPLDGITVHSSNNLTTRDIRNIIIEGCTVHTLSLYGNLNTTLVSGNTMERIEVRAGSDETMKHLVITGNTIGIAEAAVAKINMKGEGPSGHVATVDDVLISNNWIKANAEGAAIKILAAATEDDVFRNITITGNVLDGSGATAATNFYLIYIQNLGAADWSDFVITNNTMHSSVVGGTEITIPINFSLSGTGDIYRVRVANNTAGPDTRRFFLTQATGGGEIYDIQIIDNEVDVDDDQAFIDTLGTPINDVTVRGNKIYGCKYVIKQGTGAIDQVIIVDNDFEGIDTAFLSGTITNLYVRDNTVAGNYPGIAVAKTADYTVPIEYSGYKFTNNGDAGAINFPLPAAIPGLEFTFGDVENGGGIDLTVTANGAETFRGFDTTIIADDDAVQFITILCTETGVWDIMSSTGTWD